MDYTAAAASPYAVTVTATDDGAPTLSTTVGFSWVIANTNRAPVLGTPGSQSTAEAQSVSLVVGGSDPDGDSLAWSAVGLPPGLAIDPGTGDITGTVTYDASVGSPYTVTVTLVDDGAPNLSAQVVFSWSVADTNRAPVVSFPSDQSGSEGQPVAVSVVATDPDGDTLSYTATGLPPGLSMSPSGGAITGTIDYTAAATSPHVVVVTVSDGLDPVVGSFVWTVADVNRAPIVGALVDVSSDEGAVVLVLPTGSDPDGHTLVWTATGLPGGVSIDSSTGALSGTVTYSASVGSPYAVTVTATDDGSPVLSTSVSFVWAVNEVNRVPVITSPGDRSGAEGDGVAFSIIGSDPDGDSLTWSAVGLPPGLSLDAVSGVVSGTLPYDASVGSPYTVTVTLVDDGAPNLSAQVVFSWSVADTNRAPVVSFPSDQSGSEGQPVAVSVVATDPDGDTLSYTATGLPPGLGIDSITGEISGTPSYDSSGAHLVTVTVIDDGSPALSSSASFSWVVANTNRAPVVAAAGAQSGAEGSAVFLTLSGVDPDGNGLTWSAVGLPPGVTIHPATGEISGTPTFEASPGSPYAVTATATDDGSPVLSASMSFDWVVVDTNRPPVVMRPASPRTAEGESVDLDILASDPDGDVVTFGVTGLPPGLVLDAATGHVTGRPGFEDSGSYVVTVTVQDPAGLADSTAFTWTVSDTNRVPLLIVSSTLEVSEGGSVDLEIEGSDPDGDALRFKATGLPPGVTVDLTTGRVRGSVGFTASGTYAVTVTLSDDGTPSLSSSGTFDILIGNVNRPPVLVIPDDRSDREGSLVEVALGATDADGDPLTWSASGLPPDLVVDSSTGVLRGLVEQAGTYTVTVRASDGSRQDEAAFTWKVTIPGVPELEAVRNQVGTEGDTVSPAIDATHPGGLMMTFAATGLPAGLSIDPRSGAISGVLREVGDRQVTVTVTDERGRSAVAGFRWIVEPDDAPIVADDNVAIQRVTDDGTVTAVVDVLGNDGDPEGRELRILSVSAPESGTAEISGRSVVYVSPEGFTGVVEFEYVAADPAGNESVGIVRVLVHEPIAQRVAADVLQWQSTPGSGRSMAVVSLDPSVATKMVMGTMVQSLHVLRAPLGLLGGTVLWSLLLGGTVNLGFLSRLGIPFLKRRRKAGRRYLAIVMAPQGGRVDAQERPGTGPVVHRFLATDRGIEATGRAVDDDGGWVEVVTPAGDAWVPAGNVTEHVDRSGFADDPAPATVLDGFIQALRVRDDLRRYVSPAGLFVSHHAALVHYRNEELETLLELDREVRVWKGRNPAFPDFEGTFDFAIATSVLDAWDHPLRELSVDAASVPSTVVPVEFTNYHAISIGADLQDRERLEQNAWLVMFDYIEGEPRIVGLCREG